MPKPRGVGHAFCKVPGAIADAAYLELFDWHALQKWASRCIRDLVAVRNASGLETTTFSTPLQGESLPQRPTQWLLNLRVLQRIGLWSGCDSPHPTTLTLAT